jgi:hypothetical protein
MKPEGKSLERQHENFQCLHVITIHELGLLFEVLYVDLTVHALFLPSKPRIHIKFCKINIPRRDSTRKTYNKKCSAQLIYPAGRLGLHAN